MSEGRHSIVPNVAVCKKEKAQPFSPSSGIVIAIQAAKPLKPYIQTPKTAESYLSAVFTISLPL